MHRALPLLGLCAFTALPSVVLAVDLGTCNNDVRNLLANRTLAPNDPIFHWNGTHFKSDPDDLQLTIPGCQSICHRPDFDLYPDMWPRLLTWLLPVLLLVGNIHFPRVGTVNRFFVMVHFIGDPIDSMWSLLTKGEVWNRFYAIALRITPRGPDKDHMVRTYAVMLSSFEELTGDMATVRHELDSLIAENAAKLSKEELNYILRETADELVDSRSNEVLRTMLVIINYFFTVISALVPAVGGEQTSQPGGRIGTAMFLSWLVTGVLLSNTLSGFSSRRTCLRIMERYCRTIKGRKRDLHIFPTSPQMESHSMSASLYPKRGPPSLQDFIDSQPWNGGVYSYRPSKRLIPSGSIHDRSPSVLLVLSIAPIVVSAISAFVIIWFTPNVGLDCRSIWVVSIGCALFLSPIATWLIHRFLRGRWAWYLTIAKDACIGIPAMLVITLSSMGIFNTCWCWSAVYSRGYTDAFVLLDPIDERTSNGKSIYPGISATCLGLQLVIYFTMFYIMRPGAKVFRLEEDEKMEQYRSIHGDHAPLTTPSIYASPRMGPRHRLAPGPRPSNDVEHLELLPPPAISINDSRESLQNPSGPTGIDYSHLSYEMTSPPYRGRTGSEVSQASPEWRDSHPLLGSPDFQQHRW